MVDKPGVAFWCMLRES